jgi:hypothetical protein
MIFIKGFHLLRINIIKLYTVNLNKKGRRMLAAALDKLIANLNQTIPRLGE